MTNKYEIHSFISEQIDRFKALGNQIAKSAKEAANAKKEFVEENKLVGKSVDDGHSVTNAIKEENNALEQNTQKAKENAEAIEKQIQKSRKLALSYTKAASNKLSNAISKYSYGDTSKALYDETNEYRGI